jgi:ABC-2 type transport system permease protein/fluoroquinolone transport system permease protein
MVKRLLALLKQDSVLAFRSGYVYVILILVLIYGALILFAIPKEYKVGVKEMVYDSTDGQFSDYLKDFNQNNVMKSEEEMYKVLKENSNSLAMVFSGSMQNPKVKIIYQGTENIKSLKLLEASIDESIRRYRDEPAKAVYKKTFLREEGVKIPFNKSLLPVFLATEVVMFGFFIIAVMVFQEKRSGTIKAYRAAPGGAIEYTLSKTIVNIGMALIFGILFVILIMGISVNWASYLIIVIFGSALMTLLGIWISTYFRDLESFIFVGFGVNAIIGLPIISYFFPAFYLKIFDLIPSYAVIFGIREILFPTGKTGFISSIIFTLFIEIIVVGTLAIIGVRKNLLKEGV